MKQTHCWCFFIGLQGLLVWHCCFPIGASLAVMAVIITFIIWIINKSLINHWEFMSINTSGNMLPMWIIEQLIQWELPYIYLAFRWRAHDLRAIWIKHHQGGRSSMKSEMSARTGLFNLAQLWFLTEVVDFPGWENRKTTVQLVLTLSVYSLRLSDFDADRAAAEKRPLNWNVSCFQNIGSLVSQSRATNRALWNSISRGHASC